MAENVSNLTALHTKWLRSRARTEYEVLAAVLRCSYTGPYTGPYTGSYTGPHTGSYRWRFCNCC